jgi:pyruvate kinase
VLRQLLLSWGVYPYLVPETQDIDTIFAQAEELALREGWARPGDLVVAVAGDPAEPLGSTNLLKVRVLPRNPKP